MTLTLLYVLTTLAAYRVWRLFAVDDFPPIAAVRQWFESTVAHRHGAEWSSGITCPWCSGSWVALGATAMVWHWHPLPMPGLWFAAVPAGLALVADIASRIEGP